MSGELWEGIEPPLPRRERGFRYPGRRPLPDRRVLCGILYVLHHGIQWEHLSKELGFGSGMSCWRRLREWNEAGVRQRVHEALLAELIGARGCVDMRLRRTGASNHPPAGGPGTTEPVPSEGGDLTSRRGCSRWSPRPFRALCAPPSCHRSPA
ncbi:hypothetical protein Sm713_26770 [Streptomyces sp. TS71-3]|nr:hypothetical protein Sm713_26770 [Streptomyces sp. TS71-3]